MHLTTSRSCCTSLLRSETARPPQSSSMLLDNAFSFDCSPFQTARSQKTASVTLSTITSNRPNDQAMLLSPDDDDDDDDNDSDILMSSISLDDDSSLMDFAEDDDRYDVRSEQSLFNPTKCEFEWSDDYSLLTRVFSDQLPTILEDAELHL